MPRRHESPELAEQADAFTRAGALVSADGAGPAAGARTRELHVPVELDGRRFDVRLLAPEPPWAEVARRRKGRARTGGAEGGEEAVVSPMQGTVLAVEVAEGDTVEAGQVLCVVEAMKMENEIAAHRDGVVTASHGHAGKCGHDRPGDLRREERVGGGR